MQKITKEYSDKLKQAIDIFSPIANTTSSDLTNTASTLITELQNTKSVRVPFVGDFSSGKSSLLNVMLGTNILPTAITPETAVPYELYYSPNEKLELYFNGVKVSESMPKDISNLKVRPGHLVKLYLNNPLLKNMNDRGILLVDMPGIDSGVEAHTSAINDYLTDGTHYMVFTDTEKGTFTNSALGFIKELTQYKGVSFSPFLTKADKKSADALESVKLNVEKLLSMRFGGDLKVGVTSAPNKRIDDVMTVLNTLDVDKVIKNRYLPEVQNILDRMIADLKRTQGLLTGDLTNAEKAMAEIEAKKQEMLSKLRTQNTNAQPLIGSADDIVRDVRSGIIGNSAAIATTIFTNKNNKDAVANAVIQVVRPILTNSLQREIEEYATAISTSVASFTEDVEAILKNEGVIFETANDFVNPELTTTVVSNFLSNSLEKLIIKVAPYKSLVALLSVLGKALGPLTAIIINFIPDILKLFFGKSDSKKINEIQEKICDSAAGQIAEALRPTIQNILSEQRAIADRQVEEMIENESKRIDASIKEMIAVKQAEKAECEKKQQLVEDALIKIAEIRKSL